jgi:signal transduction histidine kinase
VIEGVENDGPPLAQLLAELPRLERLTSVSSLAVGFEQIEAHDFDVVFLDLNFLEPDGVSQVTQLRRFNPHTPVVAFTTTYDSEVKIAALGAGASAYIGAYGISLTEIEDCIEHALAPHHVAEEKRGAHDDLRRLLRRERWLREAERKRISREVHDQLGQQLTAIRIALCSIHGDLFTDPKSPAARASRSLHDALEAVDQSLESVRNIAATLRPTVLEQLGLIEAVRGEATRFAGANGLDLRLRLAPRHFDGPADVATECFRILQQLLDNIARHACAQHVAVCLEPAEGGWVLEVSDDGVGIPPGVTEGRTLGFIGMRERAGAIGGSLTFDSVRTHGTRAVLRIPSQGAQLGAG